MQVSQRDLVQFVQRDASAARAHAELVVQHQFIAHLLPSRAPFHQHALRLEQQWRGMELFHGFGRWARLHHQHAMRPQVPLHASQRHVQPRVTQRIGDAREQAGDHVVVARQVESLHGLQMQRNARQSACRDIQHGAAVIGTLHLGVIAQMQQVLSGAAGHIEQTRSLDVDGLLPCGANACGFACRIAAGHLPNGVVQFSAKFVAHAGAPTEGRGCCCRARAARIRSPWLPLHAPRARW